MAREKRIVSRNSELNRRWSRIWRWSLVASIALHLVLLLLFRSEIFLPVIETSAAGPDAGDTRAAAGGGMEAIAMQIQQPPPAPQPEPVVVPPVPVPTPTITPIPDPPPDTVRPVTPPAQTSGTATGQTQQTAGGGTGNAAGPGTATGTGRGGGGDSETGAGRIIAPSPRGLILPPSDRPRSVRGKSITVYVFVSERGTVVSDSTRLDPSSGDSGFDRRLKQQAAEWRFRPGTRGGEAIATWFQYVMTF